MQPPASRSGQYRKIGIIMSEQNSSVLGCAGQPELLPGGCPDGARNRHRNVEFPRMQLKEQPVVVPAQIEALPPAAAPNHAANRDVDDVWLALWCGCSTSFWRIPIVFAPTTKTSPSAGRSADSPTPSRPVAASVRRSAARLAHRPGQPLSIPTSSRLRFGCSESTHTRRPLRC